MRWVMAMSDVAQFYFDLGTTYNNSFGPRQEAIDAFKMAIIITPDFAEAHYNLGVAYLETGDKGSALEEYKILKTLDVELANKLFKRINKMKRKNRVLAAILGLAFGAFGTIYFGWTVFLTTLMTYFIVSFLALLPVCLFFPYRIPHVWYGFILNVFFGFWGFMLASLHNQLLDENEETTNLASLNLMSLTGWLVRVILWSMGLYLTVMLFSDGRWVVAILTPVLILFITRGIEDLAAYLILIVMILLGFNKKLIDPGQSDRTT
jgi:tetratricopeptide (TPR) repeat protein